MNKVPKGELAKLLFACLRLSIAGKRYHDHGNTYKGENVFGTSLQVQRSSTIPR